MTIAYYYIYYKPNVTLLNTNILKYLCKILRYQVLNYKLIFNYLTNIHFYDTIFYNTTSNNFTFYSL